MIPICAKTSSTRLSLQAETIRSLLPTLAEPNRSRMKPAPSSRANKARLRNRPRPSKNPSTKSRASCRRSPATRNTSVRAKIVTSAPSRAPSRASSILAWWKVGWWFVWQACRFLSWGSFSRGRGKVCATVHLRLLFPVGERNQLMGRSCWPVQDMYELDIKYDCGLIPVPWSNVAS